MTFGSAIQAVLARRPGEYLGEGLASALGNYRQAQLQQRMLAEHEQDRQFALEDRQRAIRDREDTEAMQGRFPGTAPPELPSPLRRLTTGSEYADRMAATSRPPSLEGGLAASLQSVSGLPQPTTRSPTDLAANLPPDFQHSAASFAGASSTPGSFQPGLGFPPAAAGPPIPTSLAGVVPRATTRPSQELETPPTDVPSRYEQLPHSYVDYANPGAALARATQLAGLQKTQADVEELRAHAWNLMHPELTHRFSTGVGKVEKLTDGTYIEKAPDGTWHEVEYTEPSPTGTPPAAGAPQPKVAKGSVPRDPIADFKAKRDYMISHPLPTRGTGQMVQTRLQIGSGMADMANEGMNTFEDGILDGTRTIGDAEMTIARKAFHSDAASAAILEGELDKRDPELAEYVRNSRMMAVAESFMSPRGGSSYLIHAEEALGAAGPHPNRKLIEQVRGFRNVIVQGYRAGAGSSTTANTTTKTTTNTPGGKTRAQRIQDMVDENPNITSDEIKKRLQQNP